VNTRINILQWILTKLGTYLVLERIWNPIDFQVRGYAMLCIALVVSNECLKLSKNEIFKIYLKQKTKIQIKKE
jgi:hypothetical protein